MKQVNIHDAKTHLSRLVAEAADGRPFVIAKAGRPMVEVRAVPHARDLDARIGFLAAEPGSVPVKRVGANTLIALFEGPASEGQDAGT